MKKKKTVKKQNTQKCEINIWGSKQEKLHVTAKNKSLYITTSNKTNVPEMDTTDSPPMGDRLVVAVGLMGSEDLADSAF